MFDTRRPCKVKALQTTPARADCFFQPFKLTRVSLPRRRRSGIGWTIALDVPRAACRTTMRWSAHWNL